MSSRRIEAALAGVLLVLLAACVAGGGTGQASARPLHVTAVGPHVVEVRMTDHLRFVPDLIVVNVGQTVKFVATNRSSVEHEFFIGDAAAQNKHEAEMQAGTNANMHFRPDDMVLMPGRSNQLTYTFDKPGELIFGCHQPRHYLAGMHGTIQVVRP